MFAFNSTFTQFSFSVSGVKRMYWGRTISLASNDTSIAELRTLREQTGLDLCGEEGEYHTLTVDGPQFIRGIDIRSYSKRVAGPLAYMEIHESELFDHAA
jgi:diphthamide synthase (EF-2-diphthine--ammonia ligase)